MATSAQQSPYRLFLSKLRVENEKLAHSVESSVARGEFSQLGSAAQQYGHLIPEGNTYDDLSNFAHAEYDINRTSQTSPSDNNKHGEKRFSLSDFFSTGRSNGGGFSNEKDPDMHTLIKDTQKEELLGDIKKIAALSDPQEKERLIDQLLERFESKALLDDYQDKFMSYLKKLPSFQKLTPQQQEELQKKLADQHFLLKEEQQDALEEEAKTNPTAQIKRKEQLKNLLREFVRKPIEKETEKSLERLIEIHQDDVSLLQKKKFRTRYQPVWGMNDFSIVWDELYTIPPLSRKEIVGYSVTVPPTTIEEAIPQKTTQVSPQQRERQARPFARMRGAVGQAGKNLRSTLQKKLGKKVAKKIAEKIAQQVAEKTAEAAITNPEVSIPTIAIIAAVILAILAIFAAIIIAVAVLKNGAGSGDTTPPSGSQDVRAIVAVASTIQACEKAPFGFWIPPTPTCALSILGLSVVPRGDLLSFGLNVASRFPNYQCGQYIWAAQKYILHWPVFPGNVGSVFQWYLIHPDHSLPGYVWIANPAIINHQRVQANIAAGDIILYGSTGRSDPGHIAIVVGFPKDKNGVEDHFFPIVTEANYHHGAIDIRPTNLFDNLGRGANILGWWRRK